MTEEMTVFGNSSQDTMIVTTVSSTPLDNQLTNTTTNATISDMLIEDTNTSTDIGLSDPNWSTNICINANSSNNNNNINDNSMIGNINVSQSEEQLTNPDDCLQPIDRLEKYCLSDIIFH
ncbi:unnamed protein product, partial [Medioppia subpectinata]